MPFEPHIVPPEDPPLDASGELQLPDELIRLEAQLRSESRALADAYPPRQLLHRSDAATSKPAEVSKTNHRYSAATTLSLVVGSAAVVTTLTLVATSGLFRPVRQQPAASGVAVQAQPAAAVHQPPMGTVPVGIGSAVGTPETESPVFLRDLSGPELEGLLDLIDSEEDVSI